MSNVKTSMYKYEVKIVLGKPEKVYSSGQLDNAKKRTLQEHLFAEARTNDKLGLTQNEIRQMVEAILVKMSDDRRPLNEKAYMVYKVLGIKNPLTLSIKLIPINP